ncbi:MAG TPA: SH3 domain-containing protein [Anaerolineales bacterium]
MSDRKWTWILLAAILASACTPRATPTAAPVPTATPLPPPVVPTAAAAVVAAPTPIPLPTVAAQPAPSFCAPEATATAIINVRNGPGTIYSIIGALQEGEKRQVDGKNADGSWWYIVFAGAPDGHGWVSATVTTTACIPGTLPVIPSSALPAPFLAAVIDVTVGVEPSDITVPGCVGDAPRLTAGAIIKASGPMQVTYYFEIDGGSTKPRTLTFIEYGSREVTESFKPDVVEGAHTVRLFIEGLDTRIWEYQARYHISC